ncbi:MAG: hypothetical protein IPK17_34735 [Chloroflexi bacterium]|uniref:hypothetical protein n=1 Tax=Candidatus Flexifilum breve TaxID=3140694 RepID=UPI003134CF9F|nr:hypothetical protein [Chloroflexota bacterium]
MITSFPPSQWLRRISALQVHWRSHRVAAAGGVSFLCSEIDKRVSKELQRIQVDPDLLPLIRAAYTSDLNTKIGGARPDERARLEAVLKATDEEENRTARLYAAGKISEEIWDTLWAEWQDRRNQVRRTLETLTVSQQVHIDNLEMALQIIARIGTLYNGLERKDQKELLRQVVSRVVVNDAGNVSLELRTPFAYLRDLTQEIRTVKKQSKRGKAEKKTDGITTVGSSGACSNQLQSCGKDRNLSEPSSGLNRSIFLQRIESPYHAQLVRLSTLE